MKTDCECKRKRWNESERPFQHTTKTSHYSWEVDSVSHVISGWHRVNNECVYPFYIGFDTNTNMKLKLRDCVCRLAHNLSMFLKCFAEGYQLELHVPRINSCNFSLRSVGSTLCAVAWYLDFVYFRFVWMCTWSYV